MTQATPRTSCGALADLKKAFARLAERMRELGLSLSVYGRDGSETADFPGPCRFCRLVCAAGGLRRKAAAKAAMEVLAGVDPVRASSAAGCCVIGVPIRHRRRMIGAAVACFPVREMVDEERLARTCDQLHLDYPVVAGAARDIRRCRTDVEDLTRLLEWLLRGEQALDVAQREINNLSTNLTSTYEELNLLHRISGSMKVSHEPDEFVRNVCQELLEVMNVSAAAAVVYGYGAAQEDQVQVAGTLDLDASGVKYLLMTHLARQFGRDLRASVDNHFDPGGDRIVGSGIANVIAMPLVVEDKLIGALMAFNRIAGDFDSADLKILDSIGHQAAIFLANHRLYADMQDLLMGVLHALTATIDAKDRYTCGHSQRVALISRRLAEDCDFPPAKVRQIYLSGLLHDIGKIGVPESILCKVGKLTAEEYDAIRMHPLLGAKILGGIRQLDDVVVGILYHHERPDGRGYPHGLKGDEVPFEGQIIGLADCFDAMTSDRTYRRAMPLEAVIEEIRRNAGTQFNARLVEKFLALDLPNFVAEVRRSAAQALTLSFRKEPKR